MDKQISQKISIFSYKQTLLAEALIDEENNPLVL